MKTLLALTLLIGGCSAAAAAPPPPDEVLHGMVADLNVKVAILERELDKLRGEFARERAIGLCTVSRLSSPVTADRAHHKCAAALGD